MMSHAPPCLHDSKAKSQSLLMLSASAPVRLLQDILDWTDVRMFLAM